MAKLLHIESCARGNASCAASIAKAFLDVYKEVHPSDLIEEMNLWKIYFPRNIGEALGAKYAVIQGDDNMPDFAEAFRMMESYVDHFKSADKYLLSIPTWSFGIPYVLKEYIDVITHAGLLFEPTQAGGFVGLVTDRPACVLYARGGAIGPGSQREAAEAKVTFMESWLRLIGCTDVYTVLDEPAEGDPEVIREARERAEEEAARIARSF
jgi:FMN-dependent NADH-azoreductase